MKNKKIKFKPRYVIIIIVSFLIVGVILKLCNNIDMYDKTKDEKFVDSEITSKSKLEKDISLAKENEMFDYDEDYIWFNDDTYCLVNFLPISGNVLKGEMLTKYLRSNGYSSTESVTVNEKSLSVNGNKYTFSCQIDGTNDTIYITWDSYEGKFIYFLKTK